MSETQINFDSKFIGAIIEKKKTTTIRKGVRVYPVGKVVELTSGGDVFARARIVKAIVRKVGELTEEDAMKDGFSSKKELIDELRRIYGEIDENDFITAVYFELVP